MAVARSPVATPMVEISIYRPGAGIALTTLLVPLALALVGATLYAETGDRVPAWVPLLLLLWLPCLPLLWLFLKSVRTTPTSVAIGRPWQRWRELNYEDIERVEQRGATIHIVGGDGTRIDFTPGLLRDGTRLEVALLLRLPSNVMVGKLRRRSQEVISGEIPQGQRDSLAGTLRARPQPRWSASALVLSLVAMVLAVGAVYLMPSFEGIVLAVVLAIVGMLGLVGCDWLLRKVEIDEDGVTVTSAILRRERHMPWADVVWYEEYLAQVAFRVRGPQKSRLRFPGPILLRGPQADIMRAFLHEYLLDRNLVRVQRRWFF